MEKSCKPLPGRLALLTVAQSAEADRLAGERGVAVDVLMDAAGRAVARIVAERWRGGPFAVACGPGNNGGDGYVAASALRAAGVDVEVWSLADPSTEAAGRACAAWREAGDIMHLDDTAAETLAASDGVVVDALFGAGLARPLCGAAATLAEGRGGRRTASVDLPSGIDGDTGRIVGETAFHADLTIAFERARPGHFLDEGGVRCGALRVAPIGIPGDVLEGLGASMWRNDPLLWRRSLDKYAPLAHKYSYGHALVASGPAAAGGAARLAAHAALRVGAGLVTLLAPRDALAENAARLDAVMLDGIETLEERLADPRCTAAVIGPGAGVGEATRSRAKAMLAASARHGMTAVLDADALTSFADDPKELHALARAGTAVLTPHWGEFGRLFPDLARRAVEGASLADCAMEAARRSGATVLLKGACTVIAAPDGQCVLSAATGEEAAPWLATAGAGDVLAGMVAGLAARRFDTLSAAAAAAWMHAEAARGYGPGLTADDLPCLLPAALRRAIDLQRGREVGNNAPLAAAQTGETP